jgi:hypothetical protein
MKFDRIKENHPELTGIEEDPEEAEDKPCLLPGTKEDLPETSLDRAGFGAVKDCHRDKDEGLLRV